MSAAYHPLAREVLVERLADLLASRPGYLRVAVDGPPSADPAALAQELIEALRLRGRPAVHVRAEAFWRDASVRLEFGHHDLESFRTWLDADALRREVLSGHGWVLPSLRDPVTNRATREPRRPLADGSVVVVSGELLLGLGLPFDRVIHLAMSRAARARRTSPDDAWTLPAFDRYDAEVAPMEIADVVIKLDDPRHPAIRGLP